MLHLMTKYQESLGSEGVKLSSTLLLLEHTSFLVTFFSHCNQKISTPNDLRIKELMSTLHFFHTWEEQFESPKEKVKHLITKETRQDIDLCIYGFVSQLTVEQFYQVT